MLETRSEKKEDLAVL